MSRGGKADPRAAYDYEAIRFADSMEAQFRFPAIVSLEAALAENKKESPVHRSPLAPDGPIQLPVTEEGWTAFGPAFGIPAVEGYSYETVPACFKATAEMRGGSNFLGHREHKEDGSRGDYVWCTYKEAFDDVLAFGVGITTLCSIKAVDGKSGDAGQPRVGAWPYI